MATSQFPGTSVTVQTATAGALTGDGTSGNKLSVSVDGSTVTVNGSNQLSVDLTRATNGQVIFEDSGVMIGDAGLTYDKTVPTLSLTGYGADNGFLAGYNTNLNGLLHMEAHTGDFANYSPLLSLYAESNDGSGDTNFSALSSSANIPASGTAMGTAWAIAAQATAHGDATQIVAVQAYANVAAGTVTTAYGVKVLDVLGGGTNYAIKTGAGYVSFGDVMELPGIAFGSLPASPVAGMVTRITNSNTVTWGATIGAASPGSPVVGWYNGTNWTVIGK